MENVEFKPGDRGDKLETILARCKCSVTLMVNDHRDYYQSAAEKIQEVNHEEEWINPELAARMIETDSIVELQFYPDTPVGFYRVYGATLDEVLTKAVNILKVESP